MQIYIHRNNEDFGPYSKEAVLEYLKQGVFQAYDYACYQGMSEWKTVSELLGINSAANAKSGKAKAVAAAAVPVPGARTTGSLGAMPKPRMMRKPVVEKKSRTGMIVINLILAALVGAGIYLRMGGGGEQGRALMEKVRTMVTGAPSPAQVSTAPAVPAPAAQAAAPAPAVVPATASIPVASVAATPTPVPLPSTVHLTVPVQIPAMMNGQVVGSVSVPQGTEVKLVKADGNELIINYQGNLARLKRSMTDVDSAPSVAPGAPAVAPAAPTAAAPSSTPAGTPDATDPDAALGAGGN